MKWDSAELHRRSLFLVKEYWARGMVLKALVLAPPSLVSQWKGELAEKFGCAPRRNARTGRNSRRDPERRKNEPLIVASIAFASAGWSLTPPRWRPPWDMVIVDGARPA